MVRRILSGVVVLLFAMAAITPLIAQTIVSGDVQGTITDPSGAIVPNASVSIRNDNTGETSTAKSNTSGFYRFGLLKPGTYTISVNQSGFQQLTRRVVVSVGQSTPANLQLGLTGTSQTVEVTADTPIIQTDNGNISTAYSAQQIEALPNPGNDITYVAQTAPGVAVNASSGGGYGNFTSFGLPATSNLFTLNGNDEMDPYLNLNNSGASNLTLGANELQESTVVSNGYTGQYGRQAGANVNYTTKSGTNNFHGNGVYWYNNTFLNANEWFNKQAGNAAPFTIDHQWAASFGGPIRKNSTFFFVDTEGLRYALPTSQAVFIPSPAFQSYVLGNLAASGNAASVPFYQNMFNLYNNAPGVQNAVPVSEATAPGTGLGCGAGEPGSLNAPAATGLGTTVPCALSFRSTAGNVSKEWLLSGRVDQNLGTKDKLFGRFKTDHGTQPTFTDPISPVFNSISTQPQYEGQLNETHVFSPSIVNQFIASGSYYSAIFRMQNASAAASAMPAVLFFTQASSLYTTLGGEAYNFPQGRNSTQYQFVDDVSITKGSHNLKVGVNFRRNDITDFTFGVLTTPQVRATSLSAFASGNIGSIRERFPLANEQPIALYSLGAYLQDQWRINNNLSLTLAVRADRNSNAVCQRNCFSRLTGPFAATSHNATEPYNTAIQTGLHQAFPGVESVAWQPRIGFAYSPFGQSAGMVFRGGVGLFSDLYPATLVDRFARNSPNVNDFTLRNLPFSPAASGNAFATIAQFNNTFNTNFTSGGTLADILAVNPRFSPPNFNSVNNNITNPKFLEWNLQFEKSIGNNSSFALNYVGNHGYDIFVLNPGENFYCGTNPVLGTTTADCPAGTIAGAPATPPDPRFGTVTSLRNRAVSNYNGLTASFQRKFTNGFQVQANYTWSHTLDEVSNGGVLPYSLNDSLVQQLNPFNLRANNYGNADYDIRHYFSGTYSWEVPFKSQNGFLRHVVDGWTLSETFFVRSGLPYTVYDTTTGVVTGNFTGGIGVPDVLNYTTTGCNNPSRPCVTTSDVVVPAAGFAGFGNERRNQFRGPRFFNSDLSVNKQFALTERLHFGVGATAFNVFNHPNFANPDSDLSSGTFGTIQNTVSPPTTPYGAFVGAAASPRLLQLNARITF
jgi:Carboxypeptidase regulatory-like domain/TonB dependent receptor/TonB-dependent Receptor Plug Domain